MLYISTSKQVVQTLSAGQNMLCNCFIFLFFAHFDRKMGKNEVSEPAKEVNSTHLLVLISGHGLQNSNYYWIILKLILSFKIIFISGILTGKVIWVVTVHNSLWGFHFSLVRYWRLGNYNLLVGPKYSAYKVH